MASAEQMRAHPRPLRGIVLIGLLGFLVAAGIWLVSAIGAAREAARRSWCSGHFCQLKVALLNYHDHYGSFPPAQVPGPDDTPWHSWRTLLLPFLEEHDLYKQYRFDEPWNSPHNRQLGERMQTPWHQCPSSPDFGTSPYTSYVVIVGTNTPFPGAASASLNQISNPDEVFLVVEAEGLDIHWMEPRDLQLESMSLQINDSSAPAISSSHPAGAHIGFVGRGCSATLLTPQTSAADIRRHLTFTPQLPSGSGNEDE